MPRLANRSLRLSALVAATALALGLGGTTDAHGGHGKPALLQVGECDALGAAAFTLIGVGAQEDAEGLPIEMPATIGPDSASEVTTSSSAVAATVDEIVAAGHAVVVYASDDEMDTPIACGAVGGIRLGEELVVGLDPVGDDGQSGVALLRTSGAEATITIILIEGAGHGHGPEDAGTPAA